MLEHQESQTEKTLHDRLMYATASCATSLSLMKCLYTLHFGSRFGSRGFTVEEMAFNSLLRPTTTVKAHEVNALSSLNFPNTRPPSSMPSSCFVYPVWRSSFCTTFREDFRKDFLRQEVRSDCFSKISLNYPYALKFFMLILRPWNTAHGFP